LSNLLGGQKVLFHCEIDDYFRASEIQIVWATSYKYAWRILFLMTQKVKKSRKREHVLSTSESFEKKQKMCPFPSKKQFVKYLKLMKCVCQD
jgi:hypothetical protein